MSILIKGMKMPPNCSECAFCRYYGNKTHLCDINQQEIDYEAMFENCRDDCPLVLVPPHGALIDRDDFFATCPELGDGYKTITDGLVVLQAEEGET